MRALPALALTVIAFATFAALPGARADDGAIDSYGLSLFGAPPKYPADYKHFDYVNPNAPKGGSARFGDVGTFDNLNPFILKGVSFVRAANSFMKTGELYDSLLGGSLDEPETAY